MKAWLALPIVASLLTLAACTRTETDETIKHVYDPYDGPPAYPNQRPQFTLPAGDLGVVSNNGSDTVSLLDLEAGSVIGSAPVGRDPVDLDGPHHVAVDRGKGVAYVALAYPAPAIAPGPHASHGSSSRDGFVQELALDDLRILGEVRVDPNPGDIVMSEDGSKLVVSHFDLKKALTTGDLDSRRATVAIVDPSTLAARGSPDPKRILTCVAPHGVALSRPDAKTAYVACYGEDAIAVVDLGGTAADVVRVPVGPGAVTSGAPTYGPYSAVLSPSGDRIAVGNTESNDVRFFNVASATMEALVIPTGGAPYFPAWSADGKILVIPTQKPDGVTIVDAESGNVLASRSFQTGECIAPHEIDFSSDGATLFVVCEGDHTTPSAILALDPASLTTSATMTVGAYPDRLAIARAP